ncbi:arginase [Salsuginibacillus halophilus]|uniref:Arginase n=1 Tax=Salsuginibacillus halophilus TaxID=517424 RepID=A0A2P8H7W6_9BACI|nr:arginase [Salsuginibacillus halophilus]PSL42327.1 arginase [Salsuginibacillus halophilus]
MKNEMTIVSVPMDLGQARRGVDMGPSAVRYAGVFERLEALGYNIKDGGDVAVATEKAGMKQEAALKDLEAVAETSQRIEQQVTEIHEAGRFPLVLGGDHSISIGTLAAHAAQAENLGVIWYDAHVDLNTGETSPSGNIHGMPLAVALGYGDKKLTSIGSGPKLKPENIVIVGARALDEGEKAFVQEHNICVYTMHDIDRRGMSTVMEEAINYLRSRCDQVHLSLDLDGLDPQDAPGVGTPVVGGVSYRESHLAMEMLAEAEMITSAEFVEVNPILDERNKTAEAAAALMGSLFGEKLK